MIRLTRHVPAEALASALFRLPPAIRWLGQRVDLFTADPIFTGLHSWEETGDGRFYRQTTHVLFEEHSPDQRTTLVFPAEDPSLATMVHELAHALDDQLGVRLKVPVTTLYAERNHFEAFAEWVCVWTCEEYAHLRDYAERDERSRELWAALCAGDWGRLDNFPVVA